MSQTKELPDADVLEGEVRLLHRRGLNGRLEGLEILTDLATQHFAGDTAQDRLEALLSASLEEYSDQRDGLVARWWFGLADETRGLSSTARHEKTAAEFGMGSASSFRTNRAKVIFPEVARHMRAAVAKRRTVSQHRAIRRLLLQPITYTACDLLLTGQVVHISATIGRDLRGQHAYSEEIVSVRAYETWMDLMGEIRALSGRIPRLVDSGELDQSDVEGLDALTRHMEQTVRSYGPPFADGTFAAAIPFREIVAPSPRDEFMTSYFEWRRWYYALNNRLGTVVSDDVIDIGQAGAHVIRDAQPGKKVLLRYLERCRARSHATLAYHLDIDYMAPFGGHDSMRSYADDLFDSTESLVLNRLGESPTFDEDVESPVTIRYTQR